jgi:hypothetical protein
MLTLIRMLLQEILSGDVAPDNQDVPPTVTPVVEEEDTTMSPNPSLTPRTSLKKRHIEI